MTLPLLRKTHPTEGLLKVIGSLLLTALLSVSLASCGGGATSASVTPAPPPSTVSISPTSPAMGIGSNLQSSATISGQSSTAVNWQVNGVAGGNSSVGTIDTTGFYIAPASMPSTGSVTITAVSQADSTQTANDAVTLSSTDPLGAVTASSTISCLSGGISGSTCYSLTVSCPGIADLTTFLKVNVPATPKGTVLFATGVGGPTLYDSTWQYGSDAVQSVLNAGFTTVQLAFGTPFNTPNNGWLTGPGGVRRLACRYATVAQWVFQNIQNANSSLPVCATGNSGGASAIAYAVTHYGLDSLFSYVEPTSGPPLNRLDYGCICNGASVDTPCGNGSLPLCYSSALKAIVDLSYSTPYCEQSDPSNTSNQARLLSDSLDSPGANYTYPKTGVNVVYGGLDGSVAVSQGLEWYNQVSAVNSPAAAQCVSDAPHEMPSVLDAATTIASNLTSNCVLH